jgi:hypothetical protein
MPNLIPSEIIENKILRIRGQNVILDRELARLYEVSTAHLKRAVKRNQDRFPHDFMFVLNKHELDDWRCQNGTSNSDLMGLRYLPMAFTELGVAMLSGIINSKRAIMINIQIMRVFVKIRQILAANEEIRNRIDDHDRKINVLFNTINRLLPAEPVSPKRRIGFHAKNNSRI